MTHPKIIQGGMGVAVSSWRLAAAVSSQGQLGVVSGTALDAVLARRLQLGDPDGVFREAFDAFPIREIAESVWNRYFVPGGKVQDQPFKSKPLSAMSPTLALQHLTVLGGFVEVFLAKRGHSGAVGINLLEKIQLPTIPTLFGAMMAGVDYVLMGAGIPREIPAALDALPAALAAASRAGCGRGGGAGSGGSLRSSRDELVLSAGAGRKAASSATLSSSSCLKNGGAQQQHRQGSSSSSNVIPATSRVGALAAAARLATAALGERGGV